jgi:hypothetical protein
LTKSDLSGFEKQKINLKVSWAFRSPANAMQQFAVWVETATTLSSKENWDLSIKIK